MRISRVLMAGLVITSAGVFSLALYPRKMVTSQTHDARKSWTIPVTSPGASPLISKVVTFETPTDADSSQFLADLMSYDGIAADAKDKVQLTGVKKSGQFIYFKIEPKGTTDLDPATGYAITEGDDWDIITLGTGGDPMKFYKEYGIPEELRTTTY